MSCGGTFQDPEFLHALDIQRIWQSLLTGRQTSEQAALAIVKDVAAELMEASVALESAASTLKNITGQGMQAQKAYQAAQRARAAAEGLIGT